MLAKRLSLQSVQFWLVLECCVLWLAAADKVGDPRSTRTCDYEIVDGRNLDWATFEKEFMNPGKPALILNAAEGWAAYERWSWDNLESSLGNTNLRVGPGPYPEQETTIREYLDLVSSRENTGASVPGIFQYGQVPTSWTLWSYKEVCVPFVAFLHESSKPLHDNTTFVCNEILRHIKVPTFLVGDETVRKPPAHITHSGLLIGVPGSGIDFHSHQGAINVVFHGKKQWYMKVDASLLPRYACRESSDPVCHESLGKLANTLGVQVTEKEEEDVVVGMCEQYPGEIVYIPEGVQHGVVNVENSVAMQMQWPFSGWNNEQDRTMYKAYLLHAVDPDEPDPSLQEAPLKEL